MTRRFLVSLTIAIDSDSAPEALFNACADGEIASFFEVAAERSDYLNLSVSEQLPDNGESD